jgi:acyl carrier protein
MTVQATIKDAIEEIMAQNARTGVINDTSEIVKDLGFTSLDVAELIAVLEMELEVDPFSNGVSLMDVRTYGDFCAVYEKACQAAR